MRMFGVAAVAAMMVAATAQAAPTQLVTDGQFQSGTSGPAYNGQATQSLQYWTATGLGRVFTNADNPAGLGLWTQSTSGNGWNGLSASGVGNFVALDGAYPTTSDNASIAQLLTGLIVGQSYTLSFDYAFGQERDGPTGEFFNGPTVNYLTASIGSNTWSSPTVDLPDHGFSGWETKTLNFTAASTSELLKFVAYANVPLPSYALLSNVSTVSAVGGVPEPATWAMMIFGFFGVAMIMRRRKEAAAIA